LRNVTQTSVVLEWPSLELATAKLRSLDLYRDGQRVSTIANPLQNTSTKISGLSLDKEYQFQLILRTTAGTYPSNTIRTRTHTITNTAGISVCLGNIPESEVVDQTKETLEKMGAKWSDKIEIDTTHFVCETPASPGSGTAPGVEYQRALQLSIPVVTPGWVFACHREKKYVHSPNFDRRFIDETHRILALLPPTPNETDNPCLQLLNLQISLLLHKKSRQLLFQTSKKKRKTVDKAMIGDPRTSLEVR
jgi:chitin biosynthesis protein CHS5